MRCPTATALLSQPLHNTALLPLFLLAQTLAGTPGYMPPEILGGFFDLKSAPNYDGTKADIYRAGVMLCVLLLRSMVSGPGRPGLQKAAHAFGRPPYLALCVLVSIQRRPWFAGQPR